MTRSDRAKIVRYVKSQYADVDRVRIHRYQGVVAHGNIPNTDQTGWFFAGYVYDLQDQMRIKKFEK